jgi:hypothetical protein
VTSAATAQCLRAGHGETGKFRIFSTEFAFIAKSFFREGLFYQKEWKFIITAPIARTRKALQSYGSESCLCGDVRVTLILIDLPHASGERIR